MQENKPPAADNFYTVLIVDDHDPLREVLRGWIAREFPECRQLDVASGEEAIAVAARERPDLVLMDVELPGINGLDAAREIHRFVPETKIVVLSNHDGSYLHELAEAQGAQAYVPKRSMHTLLIPLLARIIAVNRPQEC